MEFILGYLEKRLKADNLWVIVICLDWKPLHETDNLF